MSEKQETGRRDPLSGSSRRPLGVDAYVGLRLKTCRLIKGLSQEQMADCLGITFQQIQKYEKGINRISAGRLYEIARALDVKVSYFYDGFVEDDVAACVAEDRRMRPAKGKN